MFPHVVMKDANVFTVSYLSHLFLIENVYTYHVIHLRPGVYPCWERSRSRGGVWRVERPHSVTKMLFRRQSFILARWKYKSNKPHFHSAEFCHCNNAQVVACCKQYVLFYEDTKKHLFVSSIPNYNNLHVLNSKLLSVCFILMNSFFFTFQCGSQSHPEWEGKM